MTRAPDPTNTSTRAWLYGGDKKSSPKEEFYILQRYGNFFAHVRAAEALVDRAGTENTNVMRSMARRGALIRGSEVRLRSGWLVLRL